MLPLATRRIIVSSGHTLRSQTRSFASTRPRDDAGSPTKLHNILQGGPAPAVQVRGITSAGIELADGLVLPSACIFLNGNVFLWDTPTSLWSGWKKDMFEMFEVVVPKPGEFTLLFK